MIDLFMSISIGDKVHKMALVKMRFCATDSDGKISSFTWVPFNFFTFANAYASVECWHCHHIHVIQVFFFNSNMTLEKKNCLYILISLDGLQLGISFPMHPVVQLKRTLVLDRKQSELSRFIVCLWNSLTLYVWTSAENSVHEV
jgi:hypothetical protein